MTQLHCACPRRPFRTSLLLLEPSLFLSPVFLLSVIPFVSNFNPFNALSGRELLVDCNLLPSTVSAFAMLGQASRLRQARLARLGLIIN